MIYLLYILIVFFQSKSVDVTVPTEYSGWCYLVSNDTAVVKSSYHLDLNGVAYISTNQFKSLKQLNIYQSNEEITTSIKYLSKVVHQASEGTKYMLFKFYIPREEKSECCIELNWNDSEIHYKYSRKDVEYREKLIEEKKLIVNE